MEVSIIIATFRRGKQLITVLGDLKRCKQDWVEIIVIDQTPKEDYSPEVYRELSELEFSGLFKWIKYPRSYTYEARNYGAAISKGDLLLWLDDDVRVGVGLLERFLIYLKKSEDISIIQGNCVSEELFKKVCNIYPDVDLQIQIDRATKELRQRQQISEECKNTLLSLTPELQAFYCETGFAEPVTNSAWISANNMMIKREAFAALKGWDEYILNYGDRNLGIRAAKSSLKIQWAPEPSIIHLQAKKGGSRMSDPNNPMIGWRSCVSIWYLAFRYLKYHPKAFVKFGVYKAARYSFLLKRNFTSPIQFITSFWAYLVGAVIGFYWSWQEPLSSYPKWREEFLQNQCTQLPKPIPLKRFPE